MTDKKSQRIGFGNPPHHTRFKPGVSGNPGGRPKKRSSLQDELLEELGEVSASEGGEISNSRKIARALVKAAVGGNMRATAALLAFCSKHAGDTDIQVGSANADAEILDDFLDRQLRRRAQESDDAVADPVKDE